MMRSMINDTTFISLSLLSIPQFLPVAEHAMIAGSYAPVCPTISGAAKLHMTNGYLPQRIPAQTFDK